MIIPSLFNGFYFLLRFLSGVLSMGQLVLCQDKQKMDFMTKMS